MWEQPGPLEPGQTSPLASLPTHRSPRSTGKHMHAEGTLLCPRSHQGRGSRPLGAVSVGTLRPAAGPQEPRLRAAISTNTSVRSCTGRSASGAGTEPRSPGWSGFCLPPGRRVVPSPRGRPPQGHSAQRRGTAGSAPPTKPQPTARASPSGKAPPGLTSVWGQGRPRHIPNSSKSSFSVLHSIQ